MTRLVKIQCRRIGFEPDQTTWVAVFVGKAEETVDG
jgi:hypothetical protein